MRHTGHAAASGGSAVIEVGRGRDAGSRGLEPRGPEARGGEPRDPQARGAPDAGVRIARRVHDGGLVERILARVQNDVGPERYARYFQNQACVGLHDGRLEVTVPTGFVADLIVRRFGESLRHAAVAELGAEGSTIELKFRIDRGAFAGAQTMASPAPAGVGAPPIGDRAGGTEAPVRAGAAPADGLSARGSRPRSASSALRYRLEEFVVGESNKLAFSAAERVADPAGPRAFSPLFIHGPCGMGKTHLLQGIAARWKERDPRATVRSTTAEQFTNEYVTAVRTGRLDAFRKAYRGVDLLCIDDVQFLTNKTSTQGELLHTFDAIDLDGARVVLASDEHPRQIARLSAALVSRFMSGMIVKLDPPEPALRERIVTTLAERRGLRLERGAAACVTAEYSAAAGSSVRDIEGALTRIEALIRLLPEGESSGAIGVALVRRALGVNGYGGGYGGGGHGVASGFAGGPRRPIRLETIREEVCRALRVDPSDLLGRGRHKRVVLARTVISHLARALTTMSYPEIARAMGRPNHSTIVTACKRIEGQMARGESPDPGTGTGGGSDAGSDLAGMTLAQLCDALKACVLRVAWGPGSANGAGGAA